MSVLIVEKELAARRRLHASRAAFRPRRSSTRPTCSRRRGTAPRSASRRARSGWTCRGDEAQGKGRPAELERRHLPDEEEQGGRRRTASAGSPGPGKVSVAGSRRRRRRVYSAKNILIATGSTPRSLPGHRDRPQDDPLLRLDPRADRGPEVAPRDRLRRGRRRVRLDVRALRLEDRRRRDPAAHRAARGRGDLARARGLLQAAGDRGLRGHAGRAA